MTFTDNQTWTLGQRLRNSRLLAELDQADMAKKLHTARPTISNWERGVSQPNASQFVKWADITGAGLEWLAAAVRVNDESPELVNSGDSGSSVRPKGFEPLAFCSVSYGAAFSLVLAVLQSRAVRS